MLDVSSIMLANGESPCVSNPAVSSGIFLIATEFSPSAGWLTKLLPASNTTSCSLTGDIGVVCPLGDNLTASGSNDIGSSEPSYVLAISGLTLLFAFNLPEPVSPVSSKNCHALLSKSPVYSSSMLGLL